MSVLFGTGLTLTAMSVCVCIHTGYRSVPLKNSYSEDLELAALLVHINILSGRVRTIITINPIP